MVPRARRSHHQHRRRILSPPVHRLRQIREPLQRVPVPELCASVAGSDCCVRGLESRVSEEGGEEVRPHGRVSETSAGGIQALEG